MTRPVNAAMIAFTARILAICPMGSCAEMNSGSISSEVERKTARRVPVEISPAE